MSFVATANFNGYSAGQVVGDEFTPEALAVMEADGLVAMAGVPAPTDNATDEHTEDAAVAENRVASMEAHPSWGRKK
jgi:heptaprenylglyceryl phosphate synthase